MRGSTLTDAVFNDDRVEFFAYDHLWRLGAGVRGSAAQWPTAPARLEEKGILQEHARENNTEVPYIIEARTDRAVIDCLGKTLEADDVFEFKFGFE